MDEDCDPDMERAYQADQRKIYAGGRRHDCPDCGAKNALTDEQKRRGYHCDGCTRQAVMSWDITHNGGQVVAT